MDTMAHNQGKPEGLKISNWYNAILYDSDWIAGVDYEEESDTDNASNYSSDEELSNNEDVDGQYDPIDEDYKELEPRRWW